MLAGAQVTWSQALRSRTQLGPQEPRLLAAGFPPTRHQIVMGASPEPRRSLAVVPSLASRVLRRGYGEAMVWVRRGYGDDSGREGTPKHPTSDIQQPTANR